MTGGEGMLTVEEYKRALEAKRSKGSKGKGPPKRLRMASHGFACVQESLDVMVRHGLEMK